MTLPRLLCWRLAHAATRHLLDSIAQAFCEKGRRALNGEVSFADVLPDVAHNAFAYLRQHGATKDLQAILRNLATIEPDSFHRRIDQAIERLVRVQALPNSAEFKAYLTHLPSVLRQHLRRPTDPLGRTVPDTWEFINSEQLIPLLPIRTATLRAGQKVPGLDNWRLVELRGLGPHSEVWLGIDDRAPDSPAALKFTIEPGLQEKVRASRDRFMHVFELNEIPGIVPLRSVYLETGPPCLESAFVYGYDLSALIKEWRVRYETPRPDAALKIMRRIAESIAKAHRAGVVHRDLKPSNVLIHPGEHGKFSIWVTDFGWGRVAAERLLELHTLGTVHRGEEVWLTELGSHTPRYASPQQIGKERVDTRDDVHALGAIWFQLLKRDLHAVPPVGDDWAEEYERYGLTSAQAKLLTACVSPKVERRPFDAISLADQLKNLVHQLPTRSDADESRVSVPDAKPPRAKLVPVASVTEAGNNVASNAAAAMLQAVSSRHGSSTSLPAVSTEMLADGRPKMIRNVLGQVFVYVPPGLFEMGSSDDEMGHAAHESPKHAVRISHGFYLAIHPVTQSQFEWLMSRNPSAGERGAEYPVDSVSWDEAKEFCQRLAHLPSEVQAERTYRLPTEAEWEYACRAGAKTAFAMGDTITSAQAWIQGAKHAMPVGQLPANAWGIYDLHGNVWEWCNDWYHEYYYFDSPGIDPHGPVHGEERVIRGGSWKDPCDHRTVRVAASAESESMCRHGWLSARVDDEVAKYSSQTRQLSQSHRSLNQMRSTRLPTVFVIFASRFSPQLVLPSQNSTLCRMGELWSNHERSVVGRSRSLQWDSYYLRAWQPSVPRRGRTWT